MSLKIIKNETRKGANIHSLEKNSQQGYLLFF